ncbi:MAG: hypothetical protein PHP45_04085 [Elusimicrobiales bacterium]|nr:hypothetical protein [Elusimicrobiales bacterium]
MKLTNAATALALLCALAAGGYAQSPAAESDKADNTYAAAVKKAFAAANNSGDFGPKLKASELPAAVAKKINGKRAAYKLSVPGYPDAYIAVKSDEGSFFVSIFSDSGNLIAKGSQSESGEFQWGKVDAAGVASPQRTGTENKSGYGCGQYGPATCWSNGCIWHMEHCIDR